MPHLLSLNSYHYRRGGSDAVYLDHAELIEAQGWSNTFMSMHHPRNLSTEDDRYFAELVDFEFSGSLSQKLLTARRTIYNEDARRKIVSLLADKRIDVAHVHCIYHHLTPGVLPVIKERGIPIVLTAHDLKLACPAYTMRNGAGEVCEQCKGGNYLNVVKNRCIKGSMAASAIVSAEALFYRQRQTYDRCVDMVVAPSRFYRDKLISWGWDSQKIVYIPNFTKVIDTRHRGDYSGRILYFGRLSAEKGIETLLEAAKLASVPIDIVGSGPIEQQLRDYGASIGSPAIFHGRLDGDDLWAKIGSARAIVMPSEWYENAPLAALEAFQLERPLLGANIGGIPELVFPEGRPPSGWTFESGNVDALAQSLSEVTMLREARLAELGRAGRKLALEEFSKERYVSEVLSLYSKLGIGPAGQ